MNSKKEKLLKKYLEKAKQKIRDELFQEICSLSTNTIKK